MAASRWFRVRERKTKAVALFDSAEPVLAKSYRDDNGLMAYLRSL